MNTAIRRQRAALEELARKEWPSPNPDTARPIDAVADSIDEVPGGRRDR